MPAPAELPAIPQPQLYDAKTGAPLSIPLDQVHEAVAGGRAAFLKSDQIPVVDPHGKVGSVSGAEAPLAFAQGYRYEPLGSQQARADRAKYGEGLGNELEAAAAGAARGASLGLSDQVLTKSGAVDPHTLQALKDYNPGASLLGETAGVALPAVLSGGTATSAEGLAGAARAAATASPAISIAQRAGGVGAEIAAKLTGKEIASTIPRIAGSAVEGALFGAGNEVSEAALGDRDLNAQYLAADAGLGGLIGAPFGLLPHAKAPINQLMEKEGEHTASADAAAAASTIRGGNPEGASTAVPMEPAASPDTFAGQALNRMAPPSSIADLAERNKALKFQNIDAELPSKSVLEDAIAQTPDDETPVHNMQLASLESAHDRDVFKTFLEQQSEKSGIVRQYEANQKYNWNQKLEQEIKGLSKDYRPAETPEAAGSRALEAIEGPYKAEKAALTPMFQEFDKIAGNPLKDFASRPAPLEDVIPGASKYLKIDEDGKLQIDPYKPSMPFSKAAHSAMEDVIEAANDPKMTLDGVRNVRESIRDRITLDASPREKAQLGGLRKTLMDYMQSAVNEGTEDLNVRDTFKRWAVNEQNRELAEYVVGGKLGDQGGLKKAIVPEDVLKNIFSDSATVKAMKELVGPEKFKQLTADYLWLQKKAMTDKGAFSSQKYSTWMKGKQPELAAALEAQPHALARMRAWVDKMRLVPDAPSVNPSGTAKASSILEAISKLGHLVEDPKKVIGGGIRRIGEKLDEARTAAQVDEILSRGKADQGNIAARARARFVSYRNIEQKTQQMAQEVAKGVKGFITGTAKDTLGKATIPASVGYLGDHKLASDKSERSKADKYAMFDKRFGEIAQAISNPHALAENIARNTAALNQHAPGIAGSLAQTASTAAQFLYDKAPKDPIAGFGIMPQFKKFRPSDGEIAKWERYVSAVDNPVGVLHDMKHGFLSSEGVEAIRTVYPKIYQEIIGEMTDHLTELKADLPYQKRLQLSLLFGVPADASAQPGFIGFMQTLHALSPQKDQQAGPGAGAIKSTAKGISAISANNRMQSESERLATRSS